MENERKQKEIEAQAANGHVFKKDHHQREIMKMKEKSKVRQIKSGLNLAVEALTSLNHSIKNMQTYSLKKATFKQPKGELKVSLFPLTTYKRFIDWFKETMLEGY